MERGIVLFFAGLLCITISLTLSLTIVSAWIFSGFPEGSTVKLNSFVIANLLVGVVCLVVGIIGGFLTGRNWRKIREIFLHEDG
jgi:Mn2+/Fe2+ NRAMP family transporter